MAATIDAARLLGIDQETGTLEKGKDADIIALPGNPLTDIRATEHPRFVMRAGLIGPTNVAASVNAMSAAVSTSAAAVISGRDF